MHPLPSPASLGDVDAPIVAEAWRVLLGARANPGATRAAHGWLAGDGAGGLVAASAAPDAVRALLELYAPLCAAGPERPVTIAHLGQSLDGFIATGSGDSYYVTGAENLRHLHRLRALCDAVIVGAGTVARDDPQLTVRHVEGPSPVRVIVDPRGRLHADHRVFADGQVPTIVVRAANGRDASAMHGRAEVLTVPHDDGRFELRALEAALHARGLHSVLVEGGGATVSSFVEAGIVDRLHLAIAPLVVGRGRPGLALRARERIADCLRPAHRVYRMGGDVLFDCDLRAVAPAAPATPSGGLARVI